MSFWVQIAIIAIATAYQLLKPKPKLPKEEPTKINQPLSGEGPPVPLVYGTARVRRPALIWWGDENQYEVSIGNGQFLTEYTYGMHFGIAIPPNGVIPPLLQIYFGDELLFDGSTASFSDETDGSKKITFFELGGPVTSGTHVKIFGNSVTKDGQFAGDVRYYPGSFTQTANAYLTSKSAGLVPGYRGLCHAVFEGCRMGRVPSPPASISFTLEALPVKLKSDASGSWGTILETIDGKIIRHANAVEVIYDLLTNPWGRIGLPTSRIDLVSFAAAAQTLFDENVSDGTMVGGVSGVIDTSTSTIDAIEHILQQIDAVLYQDISGQKISIKLIREDFVFASLPSFDNSNILEVLSYKQVTVNETINLVRCEFELGSPKGKFLPKVAAIQNMADWLMQDSRLRPRDVSGAMLRSARGAQEYVSREIGSLNRPLAALRFAANREAWSLRPGEAFRFTNTEMGITQKVFRVQSYDLGAPDDARIIVHAVEDTFAFDGSVYSTDVDPTPGTIVEPTAITIYDILELPFFFTRFGAGLSRAVFETEDVSRMFFFVKAPTANETGWYLETRISGSDDYALEDGERPFSGYATVTTPTSLLAYGTSESDTFPSYYDTSSTLKINNVSDASLIQSATAAEIRAGKNLLYINGEILAYEAFVDNMDGSYSLTKLWRALLDTDFATIDSPDVVWFFPDLTDTDPLALTQEFRKAGEVTYQVDVTPDARMTAAISKNEAVPKEQLDAVTILLRPKLQLPCKDLKIDGVNKAPGISVGASPEKWIVSRRLELTSIRRRDKNALTIARGTDGDETNTLGAGFYLAPIDTGNQSGVPVNNNPETDSFTDVSDLPADLIDFDGAGWRDSYGKFCEAVFQTSLNVGTRPSIGNPEMHGRVARFRELLANTHFRTDKSDWDETGLGVSRVTSVKFADTGASLLMTNGIGSGTISQIVDLTNLDPVANKVLFKYYAQTANFSTYTSPTAKVYWLDSAMSTISTSTFSPTTISASNVWQAFATLLTPPSGTVYAQVEFGTAGGSANVYINGVTLRVCESIDITQLANHDFESGTTSWTPTNVTTTATGVVNSNSAKPNTGFATASLYQDVTLPAGIGTGDFVWCRSYFALTSVESPPDDGDVKLEARDGIDTILASQQETVVWPASPNANEGTIVDVFLKIPSGTTKIRVIGGFTRNTGSDIDVLWDEPYLAWFDNTP